MVDKVATTNPDAACEDARKDADAIRDAFSHKGIDEAYKLLKEESEKTKASTTLTAEEKDTWENEIVMALSKRDGKADLLPGLSLAYLKENKDQFTNAKDKDEFDADKVERKSERMFDKREMEKEYGNGKNKVDDLDVALLGNAADLLKKNDYNGKDVLEFEEVDDILKDSKENAAKEVGYEKTRDFNRKIAETFVKNKTLFAAVDEIDGEKGDGKLSEGEVDDFLERIKKSEGFKARFSAEELKAVEDLKATFDDANNHKDANATLVETKNPTFASRKNWITQESIIKAVGGKEAADAIIAKANELTTPKTEEEKKEEETDKKDDVEDKKEEKDKDTTNIEKTEDEKEEDDKKEVVDTETQMVNDAVQRAGEGPYQVAERLLGGKHDAKTVMALTQILKQQLIENTGSQNYKEAVSKMEVGHQFFTSEGLESIRQKVKASGNEELLKIFGEPQPVK